MNGRRRFVPRLLTCNAYSLTALWLASLPAGPSPLGRAVSRLRRYRGLPSRFPTKAVLRALLARLGAADDELLEIDGLWRDYVDWNRKYTTGSVLSGYPPRYAYILQVQRRADQLRTRRRDGNQ